MIALKSIVNTWLIFFLSIVLTTACNNSSHVVNDHASVKYIAEITELSDKDYPDNPDISMRHSLDGSFSHSSVVINRDSNNYQLLFLPNNNQSDTLILSGIILLEFIPTIPPHIREDDYLSKIGVINQEWNRQQVKFLEGQFEFLGNQKESSITTRVDLARNCLNSYLWEIITYAYEDSSLAPVYHGWFNFPKELYRELFEKRNGIPFSTYANHLENWKDTESEKVNFDQLRTVVHADELEFLSANSELYPLLGERKKKKRNILFPVEASSIQDFLSDSSEFATFSPPGFYNTKDPRKTKLGLFSELTSVKKKNIVSQVEGVKDTLTEFLLEFKNGASDKTTALTVGGINLESIPELSVAYAHKGFQMPMGIANHSFYETYNQCIDNTNSSLVNPYYALLTDKEGGFVDSHDVGIDGPLLHFEDGDRTKLHLWILSFERHAFVGHYILDLDGAH